MNEIFLTAMPYLTVVLQIGFVATMVVFAVSNIDDLLIDIMFLARAAYRRLFVYTKHAPLQLDSLRDRPEQPIALMFPAWKEADVIQSSLKNLINTLDYGNFHVFIGTYPNDRETQTEVEALKADKPNIHHIVTPANGPTCKADCLNAIVRGIHAYEQAHDTTFQVFVIQDAEDIVHPLSLKLFNLLIPRFDMVQIPVISLERPWRDLVGGHYMDEFAESHSKEMIVREAFAGTVPGAGVGMAYSRRKSTTGRPSTPPP